MHYSIRLYLLLLSTFLITACNQAQQLSQRATEDSVDVTAQHTELRFPESIEKVTKSAADWKTQLGPEAYRIMREAGTERAFTGPYWNNKAAGVYVCRACSLPLFDSDTKFKSGTGWPSFYEPIRDTYVVEESDRSYGMVRTEVLCARCDGHLGHVFSDGPQPTGLRYCINGISLDFVPTKDTEAGKE